MVNMLEGWKTYLAATGFLLYAVAKYILYGEVDVQSLLFALGLYGLRNAIKKLE